jgi:tRNA (cytidine/uridine-2'-O-)-methyltransferase
MRIALYQPDIPQNAGAIARLCACLGAGLDIIEPCGFLFGDRQLRRAGLDYVEQATIARHASWDAFRATVAPPARLIMLTTKADRAYLDFSFAADDILLLGRESVGVPDAIHAAADARVRVPMRPGMRSLNVALAAAMVLGEALRQTGGLRQFD